MSLVSSFFPSLSLALSISLPLFLTKYNITGPSTRQTPRKWLASNHKLTPPEVCDSGSEDWICWGTGSYRRKVCNDQGSRERGEGLKRSSCLFLFFFFSFYCRWDTQAHKIVDPERCMFPDDEYLRAGTGYVFLSSFPSYSSFPHSSCQ